ncbi:hypothetical protein ES703_45124 [subsurface metagenome]
MVLSLRNLEETRSFYKVELKKEGLTERERDKYSRALKIIEGLIKRKLKKGGYIMDWWLLVIVLAVTAGIIYVLFKKKEKKKS